MNNGDSSLGYVSLAAYEAAFYADQSTDPPGLVPNTTDPHQAREVQACDCTTL